MAGVEVGVAQLERARCILVFQLDVDVGRDKVDELGCKVASYRDWAVDIGRAPRRTRSRQSYDQQMYVELLLTVDSGLSFAVSLDFD